MRTTIDAAGPIVVPKVVRDALGLGAGQELEIAARDGRIEIDVPAVPMQLEDRHGLVVAVPDEALPTLTAGQVREVLEQTRRLSQSTPAWSSLPLPRGMDSDAVIAMIAQGQGCELLTLDARARSTYERIGVAVRYLG